MQGGGAILITLLALSFAACNFDGDGEQSDGNSSDTSGDSASGGSSDTGSGSGGGSSTTPTDANGHALVDDPSGGLGYVKENDGSWSIYTAAGLKAWAESDDVLTTDCTLYNCIDMSGQGTWTPVGDRNDLYEGAFDGGGHTVFGLAIGATTNSNYSYAGFFGYIDTSGAVTDLGVEIASYPGTSSTIEYAGGIAGYNSGKITACWSTGNITVGSSGGGSFKYAGGIAGSSDGTIAACWSTGDFAASGSGSYAGGIAGRNNGTIAACYSTGDVAVSGGYAGGIAGYNIGGYATIVGCYSTGNATGSCAGGIAGENYNGTIAACYWSNENVTAGVGESNGNDDTTQVTGSVTWQTAESAMNSAIGSDVGWEYDGATSTTPPTLKKSGG